MGNVPNGYAEMVVAPAASWAEVPPNMDLVDAGAYPLVLLTGAQLIDAAQVREGDVVLVTGAVGSAGRAAVFVAKQRGARVLAGVRTEQKAAAAKLGADGVFAIDDDGEIERIPPLDALADTVGGETAAKLVGKVKKGGRAGGTVVTPERMPLPRCDVTSSLSQGMSFGVAPGALPTAFPATALPSMCSQFGPA